MTIALVFRYGENAVILNDFRVSYRQGQQVDSMMKFVHFGNRMGLHVAGDVTLWKSAIPVIQQVEPQVNISNVLDPSGPMQRSLERFLMTNPTGALLGNPIGAIGFIVDVTSQKNELFSLYGEAGKGCTISPVADSSCVVIGSGKSIPDLDLILSKAVRKSLSQSSDMSSLASCLETTLEQTIAKCGASAYSTLGISPIFSISLLSGSSFSMKGRRRTGVNYSTDFNSQGYTVPVNYDYTFTRKLGHIVFREHATQKTVFISDVTNYALQSSSLVFDPEARTTRFDPSLYPCTNDVVYVINQWVSDDFIDRSVDKTCLVRHKGKVFCSPNYLRFAEDLIAIVSPAERARFKMSGKCCLIVSESQQVHFENGLPSHLFDHAWLQSCILNYRELYI